MNDLQTRLHGLWLPLVTPFRDGELDESVAAAAGAALREQPIDGLMLAATSGEGLTLGTERTRATGDTSARTRWRRAGRYLPICLGLSGADTAQMQDALDETAAWPIDGYLIASPYYSRPSQRGLLAHFSALADHALMADRALQHSLPHRRSISPTRRCCGLPSIRTSSA